MKRKLKEKAAHFLKEKAAHFLKSLFKDMLHEFTEQMKIDLNNICCDLILYVGTEIIKKFVITPCLKKMSWLDHIRPEPRDMGYHWDWIWEYVPEYDPSFAPAC